MVIISFFSFISLIILAEIILRITLGLGNPLLYIADEKIGYFGTWTDETNAASGGGGYRKNTGLPINIYDQNAAGTTYNGFWPLAYKENAFKLQQANKRGGGVYKAADIIERVVTTGKPVLAHGQL